MFLNCGVGELEIPSDCKEIKPVNPQGNPSWKITGRTDAEAEVPIHWPPDAKSWLLRKDPDVGKDWRQEEGHVRGWDGWMASQWTWVWANSGRKWRTGKPGVLQSMGSKRVRHNWAPEQQPPMWVITERYSIINSGHQMAMKLQHFSLQIWPWKEVYWFSKETELGRGCAVTWRWFLGSTVQSVRRACWDLPRD